MLNNPTFTVMIPCLDEEKTIVSVVKEWQSALPNPNVVVLDNCSKDKTAEAAEAAGAKVIPVPVPGKGACVKFALSNCDTDYLVMVDGDGQMDPASAARLLLPLIAGDADLAVGCRSSITYEEGPNVRRKFGNAFLNFLARFLFSMPSRDILSGYRILTKKACERISPYLETDGFDTEVEMSVLARLLDLRIAELPAVFRYRASGTKSKIREARDGFRMIKRMVSLHARKKDFR